MKHAPRWLLAVLPFALAWTGCATAPEPELSEAGVEPRPRWTAERASNATPVDGWISRFGVPSLEDAVREALTHNQNLLAAQARLDAALAQARIAGADLYPSLSAGGSARRQKQVLVGIFPEPFSTQSTNVGVSLDVTWEADVWGRVRAGRRAAVAEARASAEDLEAARLSIAAQTAKAWFAATEARAQRELAERTVAAFRSSANSVRRRYELGLAGPLDLRLLESNLDGAEALLATRRDVEQRTRRQLELLLGRYPSAALDTGSRLPDLPGDVPAGVPAEIVARRPDLAAAERRLEASGFRVAQSRAARYPSISLTASGGRSSNEFEDLLDGDFTVWSLAGNLLAPVFQGGRLAAGVDRAEANQRAALHGFADAALAAFAEVESALAAEELLAERQRALESAAAQAVGAEDLADEQYRRGLVDVLAVLESQRRALDAQSQLLAVRRERLDNRIDLHLALGGGFDEGDVTPLSVSSSRDAATADASSRISTEEAALR
jgi:NodT family efflux transporter outer membrane factor (OMF) lipoprotein